MEIFLIDKARKTELPLWVMSIFVTQNIEKRTSHFLLIILNSYFSAKVSISFIV